MAITVTPTGYKPQLEAQGPAVGLMTAAALVLLVIAGFATGGVWLLEQDLLAKKQQLDQDIAGLEQTKQSLIAQGKEAEQFRSRLAVLKSLLDNHVSGRRIFDFLQANILPDVQVLSLGEADFARGSFAISARARSYPALAQQMVAWARVPEILKAEFSSFRFEAGYVTFSLTFVVNRTALFAHQPTP